MEIQGNWKDILEKNKMLKSIGLGEVNTLKVKEDFERTILNHSNFQEKIQKQLEKFKQQVQENFKQTDTIL